MLQTNAQAKDGHAGDAIPAIVAVEGVNEWSAMRSSCRTII
jgi:hypothetical protein